MTPIKIKQTKKHGVVSVMSFNTFKRALTDVMWCVSMFYSVNTKITNFSISGTSTSKIIYFSVFWTLPPSFSWRLMDPFWARPFKIAQPFFYYIGTIFWMRSWRNAWHHLLFWKSEAKYWMQRRIIYIRGIVIELYVIKSWWKNKVSQTKQKFISFIFFL